MKTTTILATLATFLSVGITSVSATCYQSGVSFADENDARRNIVRACNGWDDGSGHHVGVFQHSFGPGADQAVCVNGPSGSNQHYDMLVENLNEQATLNLAAADCTLRLENEVNGCHKGGQTDVSGWRFR